MEVYEAGEESPLFMNECLQERLRAESNTSVSVAEEEALSEAGKVVR